MGGVGPRGREPGWVRLLRDPGALPRRAVEALTQEIALHGPLLLSGGIGGLAAAAALRLLAGRWRRAAWARGAHWLEITAPPEVDPEGATLLWTSLAGITRPAWARWWRGQPHLVWEIHASTAGLRIGVWVPAPIGVPTVKAAVRAAWPGARITAIYLPPAVHRAATLTTRLSDEAAGDGADEETPGEPERGLGRGPVPIPRHHPAMAQQVAATVLRLGASEVLPLVSERLRADPLRALLGALEEIRDHDTADSHASPSDMPGVGAAVCVQVCARPVTGARLSRLHAAAGRVLAGAGVRAGLSYAGPVALVLGLLRLLAVGVRGLLDLAGAVGSVSLHHRNHDRHRDHGRDGAGSARRRGERAALVSPALRSAVNAKTATGPFWAVSVRYAVTLTTPAPRDDASDPTRDGAAAVWAAAQDTERARRRCVRFADTLGAAFAAFTGSNLLRRARLYRARVVMNQRRMRGGQVWSVPELAALAHLPTGTRVAGLARAGASTAPVPPGVPVGGSATRVIGRSPVSGRAVAIPVPDLRHHVQMPGITGTGKTTEAAGIALQNLEPEQALILADPKGDLIDLVEPRITGRHRDRLVRIDPELLTPPPVINLLDPRYPAGVDQLGGIFARLFHANWGPRSEDTFRVACLTLREQHRALTRLAHRGGPDGASVPVPVPHLGDVLILLTDPGHRRAVTDHLTHTPAHDRGTSARLNYLRTYWRYFDAMAAAAQGSVIAPLSNKLRALLLRPFPAAVLTGTTPTPPPGIHPYTGRPLTSTQQHTLATDQSPHRPTPTKSGTRTGTGIGTGRPDHQLGAPALPAHPGQPLDMTAVLDHGGICLARLPEGLLSSETTRLLGSLLVAHTWHALTARAGRPPEQRPDAMLYLDECQMFLNMPVRIEDLLAQARGYRMGCVLAHQNLAQLPPELRAGLSANAATKLIFRVSPEDATTLERHVHPTLSAHDLANLDRYTLAARLHLNNAPTPAFTVATNPLPPLPSAQPDGRAA